MEKCCDCGKTEHAQQGCSRVVCPCRRPWGTDGRSWERRPDPGVDGDEGRGEGSDTRTMDRLWKTGG